jgi:hypothetical protein
MKHTWIILISLFVASCAVGNKYDYRSTAIALPVKPVDNKILILSVQDFRPYVLNGDKDPSFVGLQRGGYGNPFDVTTLSGRPMTEDMAEAMVKGLADVGYRVIYVSGKPEMVKLIDAAAQNQANRIVVLKVYDWKSDIYLGITLHCDLRLSAHNSSGDLLAESNASFVEEVGGGLIGSSKNSQFLADEFAKRIGYLFNKEELRNALR